MRGFHIYTAAVVAALAKPIVAAIQVLSTSESGALVFELNGTTFYSPPFTVAETATAGQLSCSGSQVIPVTSVKTNETTITADVLDSIVEEYAAVDDVWNESFLGAVILDSPVDSEITEEATLWLQGHGVHYLMPKTTVKVSGCGKANLTVMQETGWDLTPGPFTLHIGASTITITEAYRLYQDHLQAFLFGTTPVPGSTAYETVDAFVPRVQDAWIPVRSRLYSLEDTRPLAGLRIALKDIYDLEGVQTAGGSPSSYAAVYGAANSTAVMVKKLIDMGASVVGKTKTSQFAHGADPWEFVDTHYPFNPRADGWLTAASSSSGSACAIAGYDWIDFALGSDTRGSVRKPAAVVGSYGIRPTWNSSDLTGVIPLAHELDTAGFFARDPELFHKIASLWYQDSPVPVNKTFTSFPKTLIYPVDYFPVANAEAQAHYDAFAGVLERAFGMAKTPTNISAILRTSPSPQIRNFTAFQLNSNRLAEYVSYREVGFPVEQRYRAQFPERGYPAFDPKPREAFARSADLTADDYADAVATREQFRAFFLDRVVRPSDETCSEGVLMLDIGTGGLPSYREQSLNNAEAGATSLAITVPDGGLANNYLASTAGCPEIGVPIGQVDYASSVSRQTEKLPVSVDLIAYPGCDGMLLEMVKRLAELGVAKVVRTGRTAF